MSKEPYGDILNVLTHDIHKYNVAEGSIIIYCLTKKAVAKIVSLLNC